MYYRYDYSHDYDIYYRIKELSRVVFVEIASGLYSVEKDRRERLDEFVTVTQVANSLNHSPRTALKLPDGSYITNFDVVEVFNRKKEKGSV